MNRTYKILGSLLVHLLKSEFTFIQILILEEEETGKNPLSVFKGLVFLFLLLPPSQGPVCADALRRLELTSWSIFFLGQ